MENTNYKDMVERAKGKDQEAISELYSKTYNLSFYIALQICKDFDDALDILQDSYVKAFANLKKLKDADSFQSWLNKIVTNKSKDYLRKKKRILFVEGNGDEEIQFNMEDDRMEFYPEEVIDHKQTKQMLQDILDTLSDEQRLVTMMYYFEEMTISEIADEIGCGENTIKSRLFYARGKIKEAVLSLEKSGTKLYGILPLPFFTWLLKVNSKESTIPVEMSREVLEKVVGILTGMTIVASAATITPAVADTAMKGILARVVMGLTVSGLVVGGTIAGAYLYQKNRPPKLPIVSESVSENVVETESSFVYEETDKRKPPRAPEQEISVDYTKKDISEILREDIIIESEHLTVHLPQLIIDSEAANEFNKELQNIATEYQDKLTTTDPQIINDISYVSERKEDIITIRVTNISNVKYGEDFIIDNGGEEWAFNFDLREDKVLRLSDTIEAHGLELQELSDYVTSYINQQKAASIHVDGLNPDYKITGQEMYFWEAENKLTIIPDKEQINLELNGKVISALLLCELDQPVITVPEWKYKIGGTYLCDHYDIPIVIRHMGESTFSGYIRNGTGNYLFDGTGEAGILSSPISYRWAGREQKGTIIIDMNDINNLKVSMESPVPELNMSEAIYRKGEEIDYNSLYRGVWEVDDPDVQVEVGVSPFRDMPWFNMKINGESINAYIVPIDGIAAIPWDDEIGTELGDILLYFNSAGTLEITIDSPPRGLVYDRIPLTRMP